MITNSSQHAVQLCNLLQNRFYTSRAWRTIRRHALSIYGPKCQCCNVGATKRKPLHVDHIKPRSLYPTLALSMMNLQILCESCNSSKSNTSETDYRSGVAKTCASMYVKGANVRTILKEQQGFIRDHDDEKRRRLEQSKLDKQHSITTKKQLNPSTTCDKLPKKLRMKQSADFRSMQTQFLETVRSLPTPHDVTVFVAECYGVLGQQMTDRLVSVCNIKHRMGR